MMVLLFWMVEFVIVSVAVPSEWPANEGVIKYILGHDKRGGPPVKLTGPRFVEASSSHDEQYQDLPQNEP